MKNVKHGDIISLSHLGEANNYGIVVGIHDELEMLAVAWYFPSLNAFDYGMVKYENIDGRQLRILEKDDKIIL